MVADGSRLTVGGISQRIQITNQYVVYLKLRQWWMPIILQRSKKQLNFEHLC